MSIRHWYEIDVTYFLRYFYFVFDYDCNNIIINNIMLKLSMCLKYFNLKLLFLLKFDKNYIIELKNSNYTKDSS